MYKRIKCGSGTSKNIIQHLYKYTKTELYLLMITTHNNRHNRSEHVNHPSNFNKCSRK